LIRVISVTPKENRVVIYQYSDQKKHHIEYDTAHLFVSPLFRIGEVAKFLQRSGDTIKKYEQKGLIPKARKYKTGKNSIRLYEEADIMELADFFALRNAPGRPERTNSKIDRVHLRKNLDSRFK
jgi:predicted metal-dependent hydrolase